MPSIRVDKHYFPFFDSVKVPVTAPGTSDSFLNAGYDTMILEVAGTAGGYVEGCINIMQPDGTTKPDAQCAWNKLALINLKDYDVTESFSAAGQYAIGINGMSRVRVVLTSVSGEATVLGVAEV